MRLCDQPASFATVMADGCSPADTRQTPDSMGRGSEAAARFGRLAAAASASRWRSCTSTLHPMVEASATTSLLDWMAGRTASGHAQVRDSRHHNASAMNDMVQGHSAGLQRWSDAQTVMCGALRHLQQKPGQPYLQNKVQSPIGLPIASCHSLVYQDVQKVKH